MGSIRHRVSGDSIYIRYTVTVPQAITKAWFTVKTAVADADPGLVQKAVTTSNVPGTGQIETAGSASVAGVVRFDITIANTVTIGTAEAFYDFQVLFADGTISTPDAYGTIQLLPNVTTTTA